MMFSGRAGCRNSEKTYLGRHLPYHKSVHRIGDLIGRKRLPQSARVREHLFKPNDLFLSDPSAIDFTPGQRSRTIALAHRYPQESPLDEARAGSEKSEVPLGYD
jgi:hypothetical protein